MYLSSVIGRDFKVLIFVRPACGHGVIFFHHQHNIRLRDAPAFGEFWRRLCIFGFAFDCACIYPRDDAFDFGIGQTAIIRELPEMRIGVPGWHLSRDDFFLDGFGPRTHVFVGQGRERSRFAGAMTFGAFGIEDGRDIFVEGDSFGGFLCIVGARRSQRDQAHCTKQYEGKCKETAFFHT